MSKKPPIGIVPKYLWKEQRRHDVSMAIISYVLSESIIPESWIKEYNDFIKNHD